MDCNNSPTSSEANNSSSYLFTSPASLIGEEDTEVRSGNGEGTLLEFCTLSNATPTGATTAAALSMPTSTTAEEPPLLVTSVTSVALPHMEEYHPPEPPSLLNPVLQPSQPPDSLQIACEAAFQTSAYDTCVEFQYIDSNAVNSVNHNDSCNLAADFWSLDCCSAEQQQQQPGENVEDMSSVLYGDGPCANVTYSMETVQVVDDCGSQGSQIIVQATSAPSKGQGSSSGKEEKEETTGGLPPSQDREFDNVCAYLDPTG